MIDFNKVKLNYSNIRFENRKLSTTKSRSDIDVSAELGGYKFAIPVAVSNMKSIQTDTFLKKFDSEHLLYSKHRIDGVDDVYNFCEYAVKEKFNTISISVGIKDEWIDFLYKLKKEKIYPDIICLDVANSFNTNIIPVAKKITELFPDTFFICGNGFTRQWIEWMESLLRTENIRIDAAKVSVGVSRSCKTYHATKYKSSTVSHLWECSWVAKRLKIIADGGLTEHEDGSVNIGDVACAIRFGADFVWSGSIWAKCADNPAYFYNYYGNSTSEAKNYTDHIEGCVVEVKSNKNALTTELTVKHIKESLQSSVSYCGGNTLMDLRNADYWIEL